MRKYHLDCRFSRLTSSLNNRLFYLLQGRDFFKRTPIVSCFPWRHQWSTLEISSFLWYPITVHRWYIIKTVFLRSSCVVLFLFVATSQWRHFHFTALIHVTLNSYYITKWRRSTIVANFRIAKYIIIEINFTLVSDFNLNDSPSVPPLVSATNKWAAKRGWRLFFASPISVQYCHSLVLCLPYLDGIIN